MPTYSPDEFAAVLAAAGGKARRTVAAVVKRGAQNVKTGAQANVQRTAPRRHANAWRTISYDDPTVAGGRISAEVGYDKAKGVRGGMPGALGNLLEFGGGGDHSPPHHDLSRALAAEEPGFVRFVGDAGEQAIE